MMVHFAEYRYEHLILGVRRQKQPNSLILSRPGKPNLFLPGYKTPFESEGLQVGESIKDVRFYLFLLHIVLFHGGLRQNSRSTYNIRC